MATNTAPQTKPATQTQTSGEQQSQSQSQSQPQMQSSSQSQTQTHSQPQTQRSSSKIEQLQRLIDQTETDIANGNTQPGIYEILNRYYEQLDAATGRTEMQRTNPYRTNSTNAKADQKARRISRQGIVDIRFENHNNCDDDSSLDLLNNPSQVNLKRNIGG